MNRSSIACRIVYVWNASCLRVAGLSRPNCSSVRPFGVAVKGEEADVRLPGPGPRDGGQRVGDRVGRLRRAARLRSLGGVEPQLVGGLGAARAEDQLEVPGALAGLRGVGLIDDDGVPPVGQPDPLLHDDRELLQRGDDDPRLRAGQRLGELHGVVVDLLDDAVRVVELVDGVLELPVQHPAVGDDHDLVEHGPVVGAVQGGQPVGEPGDRVGLARPGRVLDEVVAARSLGAGGGFQGAYGVPLVVAREDHARRFPRPQRWLLDVDEALQQVEPVVPYPHLVPQVGGAVAVGVGRVAGAAVVAAVERQETGGRAGQPGGHGHLLGVDGEVHDGPAGEGEVGRVAVGAVLRLGVLDGLAGERVLHLGGGDRQAVDEQGEVDGPGGGGIEPELAGDGEPVGVVPLHQGRGQPVRRPEVREVDGDAVVDHAVPQHIDRATLVELLDQPVREPPLRRARIVGIAEPRPQPVPLLALGGADELEQHRGVKASGGVEVARLAAGVAAVRGQPLRDLGLERLLVDPHEAFRGARCLPTTRPLRATRAARRTPSQRAARFAAGTVTEPARSSRCSGMVTCPLLVTVAETSTPVSLRTICKATAG
jgi:hypothetical protein